MPKSITIFSLLALLLAGCESRTKAQLDAQRAYIAGQRQAAQPGQTQQPPRVYVRGHVRNSTVPWTDDLTLSKAIVAADYTGFMNPVNVRVIRNGQIAEDMRGIDLLHGRDAPLQPGDIVVLPGE